VIGRLGHLLVPVDDVAAAVAFYTDVLGLELRFVDGDRYAAVAAGALTLGPAGPGEHGGGVTLSFAVEDLDAVAEQVGAAVVQGGHEDRIAFTDPAGNPLVAYRSRRD